MKDAPRAIGPRRSERVRASITPEQKKYLEKIARRRGWTLSKTIYLVLKAGLGALEEERDET